MRPDATAHAVALFDAGAYRQALDAAASALASDPDDGVALLVVAGSRRMLGDTAGSVAAAERAVRVLPEDPQAFTQLAYSRLRAGDAPGAETAAREGVRLAPESASSRVVLADVLLSSRRGAAQALDYGESALSLEPENITALGIVGDAHLQLGHPTAAHVAYAQALALDPDDYRARHGMGRVASRGRPAESIQLFARLLPEHPDDQTILINLRAAIMRLVDRLFRILFFAPLGGAIVLAVFSPPSGDSAPDPDFSFLSTPLDVPTIEPGPYLTAPPFDPGSAPTIIVPSAHIVSTGAGAAFDLPGYLLAAVCYGLAVWILVALMVFVALRRMRPYTASVVRLGWRDEPVRVYAIMVALIALPLPLPFCFPVGIVAALVALVSRRAIHSVIAQRNRAALRT